MIAGKDATRAIRRPYTTASVAVGIMKVSICIAVCTLLATPVWSADAPEELRPTRPAWQQEYWSEVEKEDWTAAVEAAESLVATARQQADEKPVQLVQALSMLGSARLQSRDFTGAEAAFKEALELAELRAGNASPHTLDPLKGMGFTLAAEDRHAEAVPYLDRALLISHRTHGLFHAGQQSVLKQLANSLTHSGEAMEAERHVNYMLQVGERTYGEKDPRIVPLMCSVGDWHAEVGNFDNARRQYRDAIRLVEKQLGRSDLALVLPLRRLALSFVQELHFEANGFMSPHEAADPEKADQWKAEMYRLNNPRYLQIEGQRALLRAVSLLKDNPQAPAPLYMETLVDAGDWYQIKLDPNKALVFYREAAKVYASIAAEQDRPSQDPFALPVRLYYPVPSAIVRSHRLTPQESHEVYVQMQFQVTAEGNVENPKLIDTNAYGRHASEIINAMKGARFRPKLVDGEPVETASMDFREVFRARKKMERDEEPS